VDFITTVKLNIYETIAQTTRAPSTAEVATALNSPLENVQDAFDRLAQKRLLVPEPGDPSRIRMAPPFSGIKTMHLVQTAGKDYYANCAWDAFGIAAALGQNADILSTCPDCGESLSYQVRDGRPLRFTEIINYDGTTIDPIEIFIKGKLTSVNTAAHSGAGHLVNFKGTDTVPAIELLMDYYHSGVCAFSVPATEHSVMTSLGKEGRGGRCLTVVESSIHLKLVR